jgi:hypothetical protein
MSANTETVAVGWRALPLRAEWLVLLSALAFGAAYDAAILFKYPFAVGVDGYYYVLQINELMTHGRLYFPTRTPLVLYLLTGVSYLTGDLATAVKVSALTLYAALCGGVFALVRSLTRSTWLGVLGAALAAVSGPHLYMVTEFVNQLGAVTFLTWGAWCALRALGARRRKTWVLLALSCTAAAWLSHTSAIMITVALCAALALTWMLIGRGASGGRYRSEALLTVVLLWLAPAILALQKLGGAAGPESEVLTRPRLPLSRAAAAEQMLLMLVCPAVLVIISFARRGARAAAADLFFGAVALLGVLVTVNPFLNNVPGNGLVWRLSVLSYLEVALLVPYLVYLLLPWRRGVALAVALLVWPLTIWGCYGERPLGIESRRLSRRGDLLQSLPALRGQLGAKPIVLSPHGEQFVVSWALGVPSQQAWPDDGSYEPVYWLLHNVEPQLLTPSMLVVGPERESGFVVLAKNEDVQQLLTPGDEHRRLIVRNRHLLEYVSGRDKKQ